MFLDLYDLQMSGTVVDTRLIVDDGELSIHWNVLDLYGGQQWWTGLGQAGADNVVMLLGVSLAEANEFVNILYGRQNILSVISDKHFTVTENTGFTAEDILNNDSEGEDVELEPCEVYDQVRCDECDKVFNSKNNLAQHVTKVHKLKDCVIFSAVIFFILVLYKCMYSFRTRNIAPQLVLSQSESY